MAFHIRMYTLNQQLSLKIYNNLYIMFRDHLIMFTFGLTPTHATSKPISTIIIHYLYNMQCSNFEANFKSHVFSFHQFPQTISPLAIFLRAGSSNTGILAIFMNFLLLYFWYTVASLAVGALLRIVASLSMVDLSSSRLYLV